MERLRKKTVSLIMALFLLINLLPVGAFASDTVTLKLTTEAESAKAGDTVTYSIEVSQNPGLTYLYFGFDYDESQMTLTGFNPTSVFGGTWLPETDVVTMKGANCNLGTTNVTATGVVATVTFTVADTVKDGDKIKLELLCDPYSEWGDTMNSKDEPVPVDLTGASCTITVAGGGENPNVSVTGVTLDKTTLELTEGQEEQLTATVVPETATTRTVKWTSDSEQVTVDENGKVKALYYTAGSTGKATITVTTDDGGYTDVCEVTVKHANLQKVGEQPASCTEAGQKAHWFCDRCGLHYLIGDNDTVGEETASVIIPKLPHTLEPVAEKAATCTKDGNNAYWTCSACGKAFKDANGSQPTTVEAETLDALGHDYTVTGHDDTNHWKACSRCNEKDASSVAAHTLVVVKKTYADGSTTHQVQCSVCTYTTDRAHEADDGDVKNEWKHDGENHWQEYGCGTIMNKSTHDWDGGVVTRQRTCTQEGEKTYTCGTCRETKTEAVAKAPHTLQKTDAKAATCTAKGNNDYWTCSVCKGVFKDEQGKVKTTVAAETLAALNHDFGGVWISNGADGHYQMCRRTGCTAHSAVTAHRFDPAASCDAAADCLDSCGYTRPAGTHSWGEPVYSWAGTQDGGYTCQGRVMCGVCQTARTETAAVSGAVTTEPTCTTAGEKTFTATFTKEPFTTQQKAETLAALGHDYGGAWISDGADGHYQMCRRTGCTAHSDSQLHTSWDAQATFSWTADHQATVSFAECTACHATPAARSAAVTSAVTTAATCTTTGTRTYTASLLLPNHKTVKDTADETIAALGHDYTDASLKAVWAEDGKSVTVTFTCSRDAAHTDSKTLTLAASEITAAMKTAATCTEMGTTTYTAKVTNPTTQHEFTLTKDVQDIALLPHTMVKTEAKAATCVAAGNNAYWTCSVCKGVFKDEQGKVKTTVAAETLPIDPANHTGNTELRDAVTATCNMSGHEADTYCKDCGVLLSRGATIPATGKHTYGEDGRCTSCGNVNPTAGVNTDDIKAADTVNGKPVSPDNSGKVIASDDGKTVIKTPAAADDNTVQQVKDALTGGSVTLYVDNRKTEALTGSDGGVAALEALAASASGERKQELEKLAEALKALLSDSGRKNAAGQMVYDGEMQLCDANGVPVAELVQSPNSIQVTLPITEVQYQAMQGKKVCVLRSSTDASGAAAVTELSATVGGSQGARVLSFSTDKGGALALTVYETVSSGGSSGGSGSSTAPRTADAGVTVWCALLGISALLGTALVAKKRRQA